MLAKLSHFVFALLNKDKLFILKYFPILLKSVDTNVINYISLTVQTQLKASKISAV